MAPPAAADALVGAGVDVVSIANNHVANAGAAGIAYTLRVLGARGVVRLKASTGAPRAHAPRQGVAGLGADGAVVRTVKGVRIAVLAFCTLKQCRRAAEALPPSLAPRPAGRGGRRAATEVAAARSTADVVVVAMHWGSEYSERVGRRPLPPMAPAL